LQKVVQKVLQYFSYSLLPTVNIAIRVF